MNSNLYLLKKKSFLPLFITQFLGALNDNIFKNALVILITYYFANTAHVNAQMWVIFAAGFFILPFFLFSATAGQIADKYEKSRLITLIKFIEILLMGLVTLGFYLQSITLLMTCLFLLGTHSSFFGPLKYAILPEQLEENELIAGNAWIEAATFIAILLGTVIGGVFILKHYGATLISVCVLVVALLGWGSSLFIPNTHKSDPDLRINFNFIKETQVLVAYARGQWEIFLCILGISWFWLIGSVFLSEFPAFAKEGLHAGESVVTFFLTLFSIGLAIGALLCNKLLKGKIEATYVPLGALGISLFTLDLFFASAHSIGTTASSFLTLAQFLQHFSGWRITVDLLGIAISGGIYTVPLYALLQQRSQPAHRARVIASNNVLNALFMVIAALGTVMMAEVGLSIRSIFLVLALLNLGASLYICKLLPELLVRTFFHFVLKTLYRVKVKGLDNYHKAGERVIIIANHTSFLDALLLAVFLPDKLTFAVNTTVAQRGWIKGFLRMIDAFPLDPTNPMAVKSLIDLLQDNKRCVIFPEGRLTTTGALMKIYEGSGLIADKSGAILLPVRIEGAQWTSFSRLKGKIRTHWMPKITLTIFPPQTLAVPPEITGRQRRANLGYALYDLMTKIHFQSSPYQETLFKALLDARRLYGKGAEIIEDIERVPVSYQKIITYSYILGRAFSKSTQKGEVVGVLLPNTITTAITFFALQAYARIPAMLNYSAGIQNILSACQTAKIKTVYTSLKFVELGKLEELIDCLKQAGLKVIFLEEVKAKLSVMNKFSGFLLAQCPSLGYRLIHRTEADKHYLNPENPAVILFTSGSEGTPKAVALSHANIQANRYQLSACIDMNANDKVFNALPVFHSFGLTAGLLLPLFSGVKVFLYPSPLHYRVIPELIYDTNTTILFGTDTFLLGYAKNAHPYDFYSLRYIFAGAEKLKEETSHYWAEKFGLRIFEGYGATETAPVLSMNTPMHNKLGTVGRLLPGIQYKLEPVPGIAEGGVLWVAGPNVMKGYFLAGQSGLKEGSEGHWYNTGDVVSIDEDGFIVIKGRVKRFAKIAGEMVSLSMVEQAISQLWPEFQHAVIALPDPKKGEQLILFTTYPEANRSDIIAFAKKVHMAEIAIPKMIKVISVMPLLGTGKVDYFQLRDGVSGVSATA